jgi:hypothetical protein
MNPEAFGEGVLLQLGAMRARVDLDSILSAPLQLDSLHLERPVLDIRHELGRGVNLVRVLDAAESAANAPAQPPDVQREVLVRELNGGPAEVNIGAGLLPSHRLEVSGQKFSLNPYQLTPTPMAAMAGDVLRTLAEEAGIAAALFDGRASLRDTTEAEDDAGPAIAGGAPALGNEEEAAVEEPLVEVGAPEE